MTRHIIYFTIWFIVCASDSYGARILGLFPHIGKSHYMVYEPILSKLAGRGHHVTSVSFYPQETRSDNFTHVSLEGITYLGIEVLDLHLFENHHVFLKVLGIDSIIKQIMNYKRLGKLALDNCEKLVNWKPLNKALKGKYDVVLVENFNSDCMLGLLEVYKVKAPVVVFLSAGPMPWSAQRIGIFDNPSHVPTISTEFARKMTFSQKLENTFINIYAKLWYRYSIQMKEQEMIEKRFQRKIPDLRDIEKRTSLMIANTFHSLNGNRPLVSGFVEAGGAYLEVKEKTIPQYMERFLNESEHGVVLFSLGSLMKTSTMPKYKQELIFNVLSKLKQRVLWKFEDSEEEGTLTGNILRVKWIPQYELLKHDKVVAFIAHGGMLGMTEAISAGKPMVVMPFYGDQPLNAALAAKVGLGTVISYADLTEESFTEAVQKALSIGTRESARRISNIWRDRQNSPMDTAIYNIERVIRWGHLDPLHSPARDLAFYEYILLDVIAAYIAAVVVVISLLRSVLILILRILRSLTRK